ncbi:MAG TPA: single-stranded-DNA-specific exonuclease RecJ [Levilinea sp.]|nr:single-stranded-DNA-specific exonuclease RecJ [Levilinea sp.]
MSQSIRSWIDPPAVNVPLEVRSIVGDHPLLAAGLSRRGIQTAAQALAFLDPAKYTTAPSTDLPDLGQAVTRIEKAIHTGERIGVWGDFDVDGQSATALLVSSLRRLGADVTYYIPVRSRETHGIALPALETFLASGVDLLLTCDTGISAHAAVALAASRGVETIITDHHILPTQLPPAYAVINPQRLQADHPLWPLCGVGCAYKLVEELHRHVDLLDELEADLDLVALGTVADMAHLSGDNRWLVQRGLKAMRNKPRLAIQALLSTASATNTNLNEEAIGFLLAPRLNAIGRMGDANPVVDFLTTTHEASALEFAAHLEVLNNRRRLLTDQVLQGALAQIEHDPSLRDAPLLILAHPAWPSGVLGIAASRLVELFNRPAILLANPPGEPARGSCRSIAGVHITAALAENQDLLLAFGGHTMAAGLSLSGDNMPAFRKAMARTVERMLTGISTVHTLVLDAYLPLEEITIELVEQLERLAPFGPGNPAFVLAAQGLELISHQIVGKTKDHRQMVVGSPPGIDHKVMWWQGASFPLPEGRFDLAYKVRLADYRGQRSLQIEWVDTRPVRTPVVELPPSKRILITDLRSDPDAMATWLSRHETGWILWREGEALQDQPGASRYELSEHPTLVIGSIPPGRQELAAALEIVSPRHVILFGLQPGSDQPEAFLKRLAGLVQYAIKARRGIVALSDLTAATAQREVTVQWGIDWLIAGGFFASREIDAGVWSLSSGSSPNPEEQHKVERGIRYLLDETAAFRAYFRNAHPSSLVPGAKSR